MTQRFVMKKWFEAIARALESLVGSVEARLQEQEARVRVPVNKNRDPRRR